MNLQGRNLSVDVQGEDVRLLQSELRQLGFNVPASELQEAFFGPGTHEAVVRFKERLGLEPIDVVDAATATAINQAVDASIYTVAGTVVSPDRAGVGNLRVEIVDKNVGEDVPLEEAVTDERGRYHTRFSALPLWERGKTQPDLQARVFVDDKFLGASDIRYNATNDETLNVELPANSAALPSEYETLTGALAAHSDIDKLSELQESDDRQDITYLANKSGWDARAVALAALANQFSQSSAEGGRAERIQPDFYYALFRAGLPANPGTPYQADAHTVEGVWKQAIEQGVIPSGLEDELPRAVEKFQSLSAAHTLDAQTPAGTSTLREMLRNTLGDEQSQQEFSELYTKKNGDLPAFWDAVGRSFDEQTTKRLKLDGQLGYLTLDNAPLIHNLHDTEKQNPLASTLDLAKRGYYRAEKWGQLLDGAVPEPIPGDTPEERRANYAELLAAQVRLSFPTTVVAEMVRGEEIPLNVAAEVRDEAHAFLTNHQGSFEIGMQPVEQYIARNNLGDQVRAEVKEQIKRLQRVYQITTTDQAMAALLKRDVDSAYKIVRYDEAEFVQSFKDELGGEEVARLTYAKSQQVHNAVLNVATSYLNTRVAPALGSDPGALIIDPAPNGQVPRAARASDVVAYPTLEGLFGSMDYCACEHCRSILSPAAYLVDLLQFVDRPVNEKENPQTVLLERRPDIQHLPLTCENTNIPIPYIDAVLETLEYFVANNLSLADYTGHDTNGSATAEELLANPQFVDDAAYDTLKDTLFPPPLPFHRPLESLRRYFDKLDVPLQDAMEALRKTDDVERANDASYGWRDILMEQLNLSPAEYGLLTRRALTLQQIYGYPGRTRIATVVADLSNVQGFARRVRVTYEDVIELLKTKFINPNSTLIPRLERLGIPFSTLKALKDGDISETDFEALLAAGLDPSAYGGDITTWIKDDANYTRIMSLITIANPDNSADLCSFDKLEFRYANPDNNANSLRQIDFVRLQRFIRLWKKLGWTIEQTDKAIAALYPEEQLPTGADEAADLQRLDAGFLILLPRLGVAHKVMGHLNLRPERDLLSLLTLWAPIDTHGTGSHYRQMLGSPALLKQDPAFADDGYGNFLRRVDVPYTHPQPTLKQEILDAAAPGRIGYDDFRKRLSYAGVLSESIRDALKAVAGVSTEFRAAVDALYAAKRLFEHTETLRAAFNLTGEEFSLIVAALGYDAETPLTLENISAIFRRGWLARTLRLSVRELLLLSQYTALDLFATPDPPNPPVAHFLRMVQALRAASLKPVEALYLIWNQDISGESAPSEEQMTGLTRTLRAACTDVESQFAPADDPTGEIARSRMALVYDSDAADFFFSLLDNTFSVEAPYTHPQPTLKQEILDAAAPGRIGYDDFRKRLSYAGVLSESIRDALKAVAGVSNNFKGAVNALYSANQAVTGRFFARYPELLPLFNTYAASPDPPEKKRAALLANFLPELKERRKRQQALAEVGAAAGTDDAFARAVLDDTSVLHTAGDSTKPALDDLIALETPGLSARFFWRNTATGNADSTADAVPTLDYSVAGPNKLPANPTAGAPISGIWSGYLEAPANAFYNVAIETDAGASVTLTLGGEDVTLAATGNIWSNQDPIALTAGTLYPVVLKVESVRKTLAVRWETTGRGWEVIPVRYLYSATFVDHFRSAYTRYLKVSSLATGLRLTAGETAHFAAHADYEIGRQGWLNVLPIYGSPDVPTSQALRGVLEALLDFARIKGELSPDDERLLSVLRDPVATLPNGDSALLNLTGWEGESLNALLSRFGKNHADLAHLDTFRRVYDAYVLVKAFGISAPTLVNATTNEPNADTVRDLQSALRARYDETAWLGVLRPINDEMRDLQRDALVAYVLQRLGEDPATAHIDTPDKLFEYFLIDVQMEPCMQTSRIRHALSSVQLFIERCLLNLEPRVAPSSIKADQWEWMKRYRVWEANRKVFLWPENWLEPELRNDQSPFFKETMSELLQSDITEDTAATALLDYLSKLEEVAKLEPCSINYVENDAGTADGVAHVVARTAGARRKYYYRRREASGWTPWEEIKLDIEDNPVLLVIWKGRLLLFWLKVLKQPPLTLQKLGSTQNPDPALTSLKMSDINTDTTQLVEVHAALCWSEYYNGTWQPTKTSDVERPAYVLNFDRSWGEFDRSSNLTLESVERDNVLYIRASVAYFVFHNTHSLPVRVDWRHDPAAAGDPKARPDFTRRVYFDDERLGILYYDPLSDEWARQLVLTTRINVPYTHPQPTLEPEILDAAGPSGRIVYDDVRKRLSYSGEFRAFTRDQLKAVAGVSAEFKAAMDALYAADQVRPSPLIVQPDHRPRRSGFASWDAPFFYADGQHVFCVKPSRRTVPVPDHNDFPSVLPSPPVPAEFPPVLLEEYTRLTSFRDRGAPIFTDPNLDVLDPSSVARIITDDNNFRVGIGTDAPVRYGDREIGPAGVLSDQRIPRR